MDIADELEAKMGTVHSGAFNAMRDAAREIRRLRHVLEGAHAGFGMAYEALEKQRIDEAMLHCGHHHAQTRKALTPNAELCGGPSGLSERAPG